MSYDEAQGTDAKQFQSERAAIAPSTSSRVDDCVITCTYLTSHGRHASRMYRDGAGSRGNIIISTISSFSSNCVYFRARLLVCRRVYDHGYNT